MIKIRRNIEFKGFILKIKTLTTSLTKNNKVNYDKDAFSLKTNHTLSKDEISFKSRTYDNTDPNTQLYRGVGNTEIKALCEGKTMEGNYYATSNPRGYRGCNWSSGGGYG